jgi:hypothetical protein
MNPPDQPAEYAFNQPMLAVKPNFTPRTGEATYPADCLGKTLVVNRNCAAALETKLASMSIIAEKWEADALRYAKNAEYWQSRAEKSEKLWKEFITLMEITEESDSGYEFNPNKISSCRAMDGKRLNEILNEARTIVFKQ